MVFVIKHWLISGDTHGGINTIIRLEKIKEKFPKETGVIILGDTGINYYLNNTDKRYKKMINDIGYQLFLVKGNHEEDPFNIPSMTIVYNNEVKNKVYEEKAYPNIHYFIDGYEYTINDYSVLVVGGAYSIDKEMRLMRAGYSPTEAEIADPKKCGWFKDECLSAEKRNKILAACKGKSYDFVLSHTCPIGWEPYDLFLSFVDQSKVDKSMEIFLDDLKNEIKWGCWLFGHYHRDRYERPHVEQFFEHFDTLDAIAARWKKWDKTYTLENPYAKKSPMFYEGEKDGNS